MKKIYEKLKFDIFYYYNDVILSSLQDADNYIIDDGSWDNN